MNSYLESAVAAALAAGKMQREKLWSDIAVDYKGEFDLVTEVDRASEALIVDKLAKAFPSHDFLAEENAYASHGSGFTWIIDPLDGTTNYAHGFPWFCVSIALEVEGELRVGVIYHPVMDELFTTVKGEGAFLNGRPIRVSKRSPLKGCLLATGFPYNRSWEGENNFDNFSRFQMAARGVRRAGAAALDLAYVAAGRLDGFWECQLKPWDVAAGTLLIQEAGGNVTDHAGGPYAVRHHRILASNGLLHQEMLDILNRPDNPYLP